MSSQKAAPRPRARYIDTLEVLLRNTRKRNDGLEVMIAHLKTDSEWEADAELEKCRAVIADLEKHTRILKYTADHLLGRLMSLELAIPRIPLASSVNHYTDTSGITESFSPLRTTTVAELDNHSTLPHVDWTDDINQLQSKGDDIVSIGGASPKDLSSQDDLFITAHLTASATTNYLTPRLCVAESPYTFFGFDAVTLDPLPESQICPAIPHKATQVLDCVDTHGIALGKCIYQSSLRRPTLWSFGTCDKLACSGCFVSRKVCMRWLGGQSYIILPLLTALRKPSAQIVDTEYWLWDGVEVN
ncbi:hypothetical protein EK21DRAFT_83865 [Setomelanomma holmii]|uniref:Uncharacterized protein n=1 Tax=Setomelanomma holmii TaxID=210430 RepID=A0A9P4HMB9_9PLEO|nr:hypothetical protein EK21DRAFT_83865 [Setomelanomma holmii]